jgi:hypothetical protein
MNSLKLHNHKGKHRLKTPLAPWGERYADWPKNSTPASGLLGLEATDLQRRIKKTPSQTTPTGKGQKKPLPHGGDRGMSLNSKGKPG